MTVDDRSVSARRFTAIIRRRKWLIITSIVLTAAVALLTSAAQTPRYRATAKLLVVKTPQVVLDSQSSDTVQPSDFDPATGQSLAALRIVSQRASSTLNGNPSAEEIRSQVTVDSSTDTGLVTVSAEDTNSVQAAQVATAFAKSFASFLKEANQSSYNDAAAIVSSRIAALNKNDVANSAQLSELRSRLDDLRTSAALQNGGLKLAEPAPVPESAFAPKPLRATLVGVLAGLVIGLGLAFAADALDRRIRSIEEFEEIFDQPVIGQVLESTSIRHQNHELPPRDAEAFRLLRASLRYVEGGSDAKRILITSSGAGEGKTTVAWNLALAAAQGQARVLLIEADMRRPQIGARYVPGRPRPGLSEVLSDQVAAEKVIIDYTTLVDPSELSPEFGDLAVLLAGAPPPSPAELLESKTMAKTLDRLALKFDLVIVDSPPPLLVADPLALFPLVDGVLVVGRVDHTDRNAMTRLRSRLDALGARTLGLVINGVAFDGQDDYY